MTHASYHAEACIPMKGQIPQLEAVISKKASWSAYCHLSQEKKAMGGRGESEQKEQQMQKLEGGKLPGAY